MICEGDVRRKERAKEGLRRRGRMEVRLAVISRRAAVRKAPILVVFEDLCFDSVCF